MPQYFSFNPTQPTDGPNQCSIHLCVERLSQSQSHHSDNCEQHSCPLIYFDVLFCSFARHKAALSACPGAAISNARRQLLSQRRAHVRLSVQFLPRLSQPLTEVSQLMAVIVYAITLPASISIQIAHCDYH